MPQGGLWRPRPSDMAPSLTAVDVGSNSGAAAVLSQPGDPGGSQETLGDLTELSLD